MGSFWLLWITTVSRVTSQMAFPARLFRLWTPDIQPMVSSLPRTPQRSPGTREDFSDPGTQSRRRDSYPPLFIIWVVQFLTSFLLCHMDKRGFFNKEILPCQVVPHDGRSPAEMACRATVRHPTDFEQPISPSHIVTKIYLHQLQQLCLIRNLRTSQGPAFLG